MPQPRRSSRRLWLWVPVVVLVLIGVVILIGVATGGGTKTQWYQEGYEVGRDKASSLAKLSVSPESACNLALNDKIKFNDNPRSTRVKDLRRGCVQGVEDVLK